GGGAGPARAGPRRRGPALAAVRAPGGQRGVKAPHPQPLSPGGRGEKGSAAMIDLSTTYLGLPLRNPLVVSASPLSEDLGNLCDMEDAGAAAVVLHSLFEEQLTLESQDLSHFLSHGTESFPEALTYFPDMADYNLGPEGYVEHIRQAKAAVKIPVIASLN